ncbi:MAG: hypothetical protein R3A52_29190 [Polyangiales bacterium]
MARLAALASAIDDLEIARARAKEAHERVCAAAQHDNDVRGVVSGRSLAAATARARTAAETLDGLRGEHAATVMSLRAAERAEATARTEALEALVRCRVTWDRVDALARAVARAMEEREAEGE